MERTFDLKDLCQEIEYKWRIQSFSKNKASASCVAYIDARDCQALLDEVVGPENWQSDYKEVKGNLYSGVGIRLNNDWSWKWDCGTESNTEKEKGEASDAFKRACVQWGIGRFLYKLGIEYVKTNEAKSGNNYPYPIDDYGNKVKDLTVFINQSKTSKITQFKKKDGPEKIDSFLEIVLNELDSCETIESLRVIREKYQSHESKNTVYKKALAKKIDSLKQSNKAI
jgi:hypothetical protein